MVRQILGEISEQLAEQAKHTAKTAKQAPVVIFQRTVGVKTAEEKKASKDQSQEAVEKLASGTAGQQQQAVSPVDIRRQQIEAEKEAHLKKMRKILHRRLFSEAQKVRQRKSEEERLLKMEEEKRKKEKEKKVMGELEQKKKEEALAVKMLKRAKGAGEFGPKKVQ
ncbi:MAG: hypothetical protein A2900_04810 [Candidatus Chisholmbacteria bacterium RIFCSPLOWO2_01_FULL_50_28]|uniref:Uncharacterized protein n=1 Tax=Candidatus Chisholmbacteria bacterium RIFCSPHIGHO2_01_FULL_52_32 TaxID=1797591 RepID=A0A1G1VS88_9BACT|nr:MAG: hypothetical protein A2786_01935 [Candidatus Chisholmbacteria bacterium RIFCSPHIGHO2_01_FULL_52_32]OGY20368.1 MAG: hypothetical protein A2900_04810 [Candidatus Chisholmbacteria bacterium RIFCSPLOWO2_01_FULL_50_28]